MKLRGLYAITPETPDTEWLARTVAEALRGGAAAIQYRQKGLPREQAEAQARALQALCRAAGRPLIINDSIELMLAIDADGLHLGRDDGDPFAARERIGAGKLLGVSCYDDFDRAYRYREVADQIAFGSVFASPTKPDAVRAPLELFGRARALGLNTVAIGGITAANARQVIDAGADAVAVISAVFDAPDVAAAAAGLVRACGG
ncbi:MAG: thiamine phosphate synthase [Burkholderiaceae bacterium]